jgi:hypothetical protein
MKYILSALFAVCLPLAAHADNAKALLSSGNWESFTYMEKGGKVCYMASGPVRSLGAPKGRAKVFITVTHRTADKSIGVVSVSQGIAYKKDGTAELDVSGAHFSLYVTGDSAWSRDDKAVVAAMLKGKTVVMHGAPAKGDPVIDSFSLDGFAKVYAEIGKACGIGGK